VKEDLIATIVGNDEAVSLLSYDFLDDASHGYFSSSFLGLKKSLSVSRDSRKISAVIFPRNSADRPEEIEVEKADHSTQLVFQTRRR
jgi:hypothetical protein